MLGSYWTGQKQDEDRVTVAEEAQVSALLRAGVPTVIDATHLHPPYLRKWAKLATRLGVEFEVVDIRTEPAACISNDLCRERSVGRAVIERQVKSFPMEKWPVVIAKGIHIEPYRPDIKKPEAIIVDIDGTLAINTGRSPYDYSRVDEDRLDHTIHSLVEVWRGDGHRRYPARHVLIVSGRDDSCYDQTHAWLTRFGVPFDQLLMRPADARDERGGKLPDWIVKLDLFDKHIRHNYWVDLVLDDRDQVVDMWRKLGLKCLQVEPGDF